MEHSATDIKISLEEVLSSQVSKHLFSKLINLSRINYLTGNSNNNAPDLVTG
jgi:hypothetical protein